MTSVSLNWKSVTWNYFSHIVKQVSNALLNLGVEVQENIGVFSQNAVQYMFTDFGAFGVRAVTVPFYATSSEEQIRFMISDAEVRLLFVGEQEQYDKAHRVFPAVPHARAHHHLRQSVTIHPNDANAIYFDDFLKLGENFPRQTEVEKRYADASFDDICNILYTSGTTGDSKGVILSYSQYYAAFEANRRSVPVDENDVVMNFLPYTHVFERGWAILCLTVGAQLVINTYPKEIQESMRETHPTCMSSVPRFWEKVYVGVKAKSIMPGGAKEALFKKALSVGRRHNIEYLSNGGSRPPVHLKLEYAFYNKMVFSLIRKQLGLENAHFFPTAGATVSPEVEEFIHSIGINMMVGYGLTESLATVSNDHLGEPYTIGSVGRPIGSIDIKIGENDEILLKGPTITRGYYKREAPHQAPPSMRRASSTPATPGICATASCSSRTASRTSSRPPTASISHHNLLSQNCLLISLSSRLLSSPTSVSLSPPSSCPISPCSRNMPPTTASRPTADEELCRPTHHEDDAGAYGHPAAGTWPVTSASSGELTNTLKIRRNVLAKNYAAEIDEMYKEEV